MVLVEHTLLGLTSSAATAAATAAAASANASAASSPALLSDNAADDDGSEGKWAAALLTQASALVICRSSSLLKYPELVWHFDYNCHRLRHRFASKQTSYCQFPNQPSRDAVKL